MTLALMLTASLLQPLVGLYTDRRPGPYSLVIGMGFSLVGLLLLSVASTFPDAPRRRRPGRHRLVGVPPGVVARSPGWPPAAGTAWRSRCSRSAATSARRSARCSRRSSSCRGGSRASPGARCWRSSAIVVLWRIGGWYRIAAGRRRAGQRGSPPSAGASRHALPAAGRLVARDPGGADLLQVLLPGEPEQLLHLLPDQQVSRVGAHRADRSVRVSGAVAAGTILGGPIGDRFGRKR